MRILMTADPELPVPPRLYGGIERIVADLAGALQLRGHEVALAAHPESTVNVQRLYGWSGASSARFQDTIRNGRTLARAVREYRPELVHSFSRLFYLGRLLVSKLPKIMSYQRQPSLRTTRWARWLAGSTLTFTGCSEYISAAGRSAGGDWHAIPNFIEPSRYTWVDSVAADAPLVFLSRVEAIKGAHVAIEVAKRCGRRLLLAGNHADDGENGRYWREEIEPELGKNGIEYRGAVDDEQKNALLGSAAAMLVPIQWEEPFGIVFAEALACGTPVISCPRGALPEIVRQGVEGFLCRSIEEMVAAVGKVQTLSRAACRERVEKKFATATVVRQYEELYERLI